MCIAERISDVQAGMDRLFGGAIFMVLGLSLEKFHEDQAETLPGGGWGARRHCLEGRARASRNFASSGPRPSEGRRAPNEREGARTAKAAPHANEVAVRSWRVLSNGIHILSISQLRPSAPVSRSSIYFRDAYLLPLVCLIYLERLQQVRA